MSKYFYTFLFTGMLAYTSSARFRTVGNVFIYPDSVVQTDSLPAYHNSEKKSFFIKSDTLKKTGPRKKLEYIMAPVKIFLSGSYDTKHLQWFFRDNTFNQYEWVRIAVGVQNNLGNDPRWRIHGNAGYGTKDGEFKYGGGLAYHLTRDRLNKIDVFYKSDIERPGKTVFLKPDFIIPAGNPLLIGSKEYLLDRSDRIGAAAYFTPFNWTHIQLFAQKEYRNSRQYELNGHQTYSINTNQIGLNFRYAPNEVMTRNELTDNIQDRDYPIVRFQLTKYIPFGRPVNADHFWKGSFDITQRILRTGIGNTYVLLSGGFTNGNVPFPYLFNHLAIPPRLFGKNSMADFQSMDVARYAYNQYSSVALNHNFGETFLNYSKEWFKPEFSVSTRAAWSKLTQPADMVNERIISDFRKGFFETGITVKNLIRIKIEGTYIGFGGTVVYGFDPGNPAASQFRIAPVITTPAL